MSAPLEPPDWVEQIGGPAALLRPTPWRLTCNAALGALLRPSEREQSGFHKCFKASGDGVSARLARGQAFHGRLRLDPAPGSNTPRLLHVDFAPLPGREDWICTFVDLTPAEHVHGRRALTLQRLSDTLDQLQELVSMVSHEEILLYVNRAYARHHATTPEAATHKPLRQVMADNYFLTAPFRGEFFRSRQAVRYERIIPDLKKVEDRVLNIVLCPVFDEPGGPPKMATLARDVTLRHQGMQALRQTLDRLNALFEAGIEGILLSDQGIITDANPIACRHICLERGQLIGQPLVHALEMLGVPPLDGLLEGAGREDMHLSLWPGTGNRSPLHVQAITFMDENRPCQAVLLQDVSYRYEAQQRIDRLVADLRWQTARAEAADRGKSVFLASASHDLRQPIHALGLFLTAIQSLSRAPPPLPSEPFMPIVQRMRASLDGLMRLLDMLLGASLRDVRQQAVPSGPIALQPAFDGLMSEFAPLAAEKGLALRAVPSRAWVLCDATVLHRVLANLVSNAIRYTDRGRIVLGARSRGAELELQVWDTGIGIDPDQLDNIFQTFHRGEAPRVAPGERAEGLGLSIVRRAAADIGARLDVRSTPGCGSMFSVRLPRGQPQGQHTPREAAVQAPTASDRHILLIEDDEQVLLATASLLESWGHRVFIARSATEALRLFEAEPRHIDALICDYMLDPSMDGLALLLRLRERHPGSLPVCMITGDMSAERIEQAKRHGFTLLHKPVHAAELERFLLTAAHGARPDTALP
ncbi:MAG: response regulator [Hydrogenophaga sp.]|uniref:PAS domain-containing hybrid sensor histidine kinase/response regulator n=1 Tax=Hydrogenophaga sp. TaxID=1904254 RepID=UPI001693D7F5|nr:ATP-binding protein [Hydrogenophaga sp.]NIM43953.1 response regulator [Hydrogenophaga sp.]NIN29017.1 response regulator [Hydrogenophaga sp.]NIN33494.1 response regulator [Hydrogenophaga sp.]NIN58153.1 response regulator [Hydrogenophaga sp.]NIO54451.1 response regulator [Hydrogenophaga sp.]